MHQSTGRFVPGWDPALNCPIDGDQFTRQAAAAATLGRASGYFKNDAYMARAAQAILTLLAETGPDPRDPTSRCTMAPSLESNRLSAAGLLLTAIHGLPAPASDLLDQGEQLARYIVRQQRSDGALVCSDLAGADDPESKFLAPGYALAGLVRSHSLRPAAWKLESARKALPYYRTFWDQNRCAQFASTMIPAMAEAFLQSKDRARDAAFAEFAFAMADWLCSQQYHEIDPRHPLWRGGFPTGSSNVEPSIMSASSARAILDAARVTRQLPDVERFSRYRDAAVLALQFAATLQYTEANTLHFVPAYRQQHLLGGFHTSHRDGTLQLDGSQHAVAAMLAYFMAIADL
jgi:hypothetical protein